MMEVKLLPSSFTTGLILLAVISVRFGTAAMDDDYDDEASPCYYLPAETTNSSTLTNFTGLTELLDYGSAKMSSNGYPTDQAVILLGDTKSGKTTLAKILSTELSRLHLVKSQKEKAVIVDEDVRYSNAAQRRPHPLIPDLALGQSPEDSDEPGVNLYNCPSFVGTHGPDKDVAVNFFMHRLLGSLTSVKIILVAAYTTPPSDFDKLISNATKLLKDIPKYSDSIGLVITKVNADHEAGSVILNVVQYLSDYLHNLYIQEDSESTQDLREEARRKIQIVEPLLEQNQQKKYFRISFDQLPEQCGPLNESRIVSRNKQRIIKFYSENLEYSPVSLTDFGYTLDFTDKAKLILRNSIATINHEISMVISGLIDNFMKFYYGRLSSISVLRSRLEVLQNSTGILREALVSMKTLGDTSNTGEFMEILVPALEEFGYSTPVVVQEFMGRQEEYSKFDDQINAPGIIRMISSWTAPVQEAYSELVTLEKETSLLLQLEEKEWENNRLIMEMNGLQGDGQSWRDSELQSLNELETMLRDLNGA